jgi:dTMP kinase
LSTIRRGVFISFEGNDGSGKSTQMKLLAARLRESGYAVVENVEPGGTPIGQQIRRILLDGKNNEMTPVAELLLMFASRAQAAGQWIVPALARGDIVLSDRFTDSSLAYQGAARGLGFETVWALHKLTLGELMPGLTICVEIGLAESLARARGRNRDAAVEAPQENRLDDHELEFHETVRRGYHEIAALEPKRFRIVDGSAEPPIVAHRVWELVEPLIREQTGSRSF